MFSFLQFQYKIYFTVTTTDIKHYSLLCCRSQQWLHLYSVLSRRFLVTNLNNQNSPASVLPSNGYMRHNIVLCDDSRI
jgi:hypothetical protein